LDPVSNFQYPEITERLGYFVGFADNLGDALAITILKIELIIFLYTRVVIYIEDQAKASEWHEAMVNANIDIFEMSYEESVSYFKRLENLEKIRRTNSPNPSSLPVENIYICYQ
jgi:hypothetical protein